MNLITGRAGVAHITPRQDAMWHQGLIEMESCIFDAYENFAAEIITNNEVRIRSGVGMLQGRFFCIEPNTYDSADIANGNQGEYRKDLIVARITVDASTNTQSASIEVIQGTPAAENPTAPETTVGDLDAGDLIADYPLVEVLLNGINIESLTPVFDTGWLFNGAGRQKINFIGTNPIASVEDDTPANWAARGSGIAFFNDEGMPLVDQPHRYLVIHNMVVDGNQVHQIAFQQRVGGIWHRGGNPTQGWSGTWRKLLDETNGIQMKKLWQNASPSSTFGAQTLTISGLYDAIIIVPRYSNSYANLGAAVIANTTGSSVTGLLTIPWGTMACREFTITRDTTNNNMKIAFKISTYYQGTTQGSGSTTLYCIPVVIYGIKGVS